MIGKIISGGQTGADQAALDVAIEFGIPYGGWLPRGRKTEAGRLPERYLFMEEMVSGRYADRTLQNILDSDATLIFSHGALAGGSKLTRQLAEQHARLWLHIDLNRNFRFKAAEMVRQWIIDHPIVVLNVAGSRASSDPKIYQAVYDVLQTALFMDIALAETPGGFRRVPLSTGRAPATVDSAVERLLRGMSLRERTRIARLPAEALPELTGLLWPQISGGIARTEENPHLLESSRRLSNNSDLQPDAVPALVIRTLWERLRATHQLRIVK